MTLSRYRVIHNGYVDFGSVSFTSKHVHVRNVKKMRLAQEYNAKIEERLADWFLKRGLDSGVLYRHLIGWDGRAITIPVFDAEGQFLFFKYRRAPWTEDGPKYWYAKEGGKVSLYNADQLPGNPDIVICEGEFDCLALEAQGIPAVTSTGGAGSFQEAWVPLFAGKNVFVCLDNDKAGLEGAIRICKMIDGAKIVPLPEGVKDVSDFFAAGRIWEDFMRLVKHAWRPEFPKESPRPKRRVGGSGAGKLTASDIQAAKDVPIRDLVGTQVTSAGFTRCPFHDERTASFRIFPDNHAHCFGCNFHGDAIDFVMKSHDGMMFADAVKFLTNKL